MRIEIDLDDLLITSDDDGTTAEILTRSKSVAGRLVTEHAADAQLTDDAPLLAFGFTLLIGNIAVIEADLAERDAHLNALREKLDRTTADRETWIARARSVLEVVGGNKVGQLVKLLDERGHGAVDRDLQELLDKLRPAVCW